MKHIYTALENLLSTDKFEIKCCQKSDPEDGVLGFMGDHSKLSVKYTLDGIESEVFLFVKEYPKGNAHRAAFNDQFNTFFRETKFYKSVTKRFIKYNENEIWHPKCLYSDMKTFIFEDLSVKGFKMQDLYKGLDDDHCYVALDAIARMHTASIILEETSKYRLEDSFKGNRFKSNFLPSAWMNFASKSAKALVNHSVKYGESTCHFKKVLQEWDKAFIDACSLMTQPQKIRKVLNHLDLWNNNLMFNYKDDIPNHCVIVDFQAYIITSPAVDLMGFLYLNLNPHNRIKRFAYLQEYYYKKFCEILSFNNLKASHILDWELFKKSCEEYTAWGLIHAVILFQFIFIDQDMFVQSLNDSEAFLKLSLSDRSESLLLMLKQNPVFKSRMMSNIDEFIGRFIIKDM